MKFCKQVLDNNMECSLTEDIHIGDHKFNGVRKLTGDDTLDFIQEVLDQAVEISPGSNLNDEYRQGCKDTVRKIRDAYINLPVVGGHVAYANNHALQDHQWVAYDEAGLFMSVHPSQEAAKGAVVMRGEELSGKSA